jgi:hypothetical protein
MAKITFGTTDGVLTLVDPKGSTSSPSNFQKYSPPSLDLHWMEIELLKQAQGFMWLLCIGTLNTRNLLFSNTQESCVSIY